MEEPRASSADRRRATDMLRRIRPPSAPVLTIVIVVIFVGAPAGSGERIGEYARHVCGRDTAALVADTHGQRCGLVDAWETWRGYDGDEYRWEGVCADGAAVLLLVVLDGRAEGVLQDLGEDVFHVHGDVAVGWGLRCAVRLLHVERRMRGVDVGVGVGLTQKWHRSHHL